MHAQGVSHPQQVADLHLFAGFHALDGVAGEFRGFPQALLAPAEVVATQADAVTDRPAGFSDPRGMVGWHGVHAVPLLILCQPQFWGISRSWNSVAGEAAIEPAPPPRLATSRHMPRGSM